MERLNVTHVHIKVSCGRVLSKTYKFAVRNRFHFLSDVGHADVFIMLY